MQREEWMHSLFYVILCKEVEHVRMLLSEGSLEPNPLGYGESMILFLVHSGLMHIRHSYDREVVFVAFAILILNPILYFLEMNLMHLLSCLGSVAPASLF